MSVGSSTRSSLSSPYTPADDDDVELPLLDDEEFDVDVKKGSDDKNAKKRKQCPPTCLVCSRAATGHHYDVPSCNGCKTFFRRVLVSGRAFKCRIGGGCFQQPIEEALRNCRACRFDKCVAVGMNPLAMDVTEDVAKNANYRAIVRKANPSVADFGSVASVCLPTKSIESEISDVIGQLMHLEIKLDEFRKCTYNPSREDLPGLEAILRSSCCLDIAARFGPMQNLPPVEIQPVNHPSAIRKRWFMYDALTTVEYAKTFGFFKQLDISEQVLLIKSVALLCYNLMWAFSAYELKSDLVVMPDGSFAGSPYPPDSPQTPVYYANLRRATSPLIRNSVGKTEYVLLKAIMLCNPAVSGLSERGQKILGRERIKFSQSLFHHCMAQHGVVHGPAQFTALLGIVDVMEQVQKAEKDFYVLAVCFLKRPFRSPLLDDLHLDDMQLNKS